MTLGPTEPSMTGNSTDLPVALSVNVIDPVTAPTFVVLPSIDPPQCCLFAGGWLFGRREYAAGAGLSNAVRFLQCNIADARCQYTLLRPWPGLARPSTKPRDCLRPLVDARAKPRQDD